MYHTWSRCVQRAFLCGEDPLTGLNFDHRRTWIKLLLEYQASVFAVDVANYTVLSNHQHLIARTRPDISAAWSDEEVAWRWILAWPSWIDGRWTREPTDEQIQELLTQKERIPVLRANLASLSWFMARWKEPIAKLANLESGTKGHFYEQRFGSRELLDEGSNLCCNVYLDLNQVKAGLAESLIQSNCSAIQDRMLSWRRNEARESVEHFRASVPPDYQLATEQIEQLLADCFLSPIGDQGPLLLIGAADQPDMLASSATSLPVGPSDPDSPIESMSDVATDVSPSNWEWCSQTESPDEPSTVPDFEPRSSAGNRNKPREPTYFRHLRLQHRRRRRASAHSILGMPCDQYLGIVQWSAEQLKSEVRHPPPAEWDAFLRRWGVEPSRWCDVVEHFGELFHRAVGHLDTLKHAVQRAGRKWFQGCRPCGDVFT